MTRTRRAGFLALATGLGTACYAPRASANDADPWFGPDKALHFGISAGLAGGGYAVSALFLDKPWQRAVAGSAFSLTLGAGKELYDLTGHGDPSWRDFTWDVAGTAVGIGVALLVDAAISSGKIEQRPSVRERPDATRNQLLIHAGAFEL